MLVHRFNEAAPDTPAAEAWLDSQAWLHRVGTPIEQDVHAASGQPVIYRLDYASGHGVGSTADAQKDEFADVGAFVLDVTRTHAAVAPTM
ncbi:hypothetical protein [Luteimonas granuli]|nr:hypothetical protein [Luteimonas granuli]